MEKSGKTEESEEKLREFKVRENLRQNLVLLPKTNFISSMLFKGNSLLPIHNSQLC